MKHENIAHCKPASFSIHTVHRLLFCSRLLEKKPDAKVVVICPTVFLTSQQATVFAAEGFHDQVNAYSGENSLPPPLWPAALKKDSILVMTPQLLCSILDEGQGNFHEVDILVRNASIGKMC